MKKFKVGDIVRIREDSEYYRNEVCNPKDVDGVIISVEEGGEEHEEAFYIRVDWSNSHHNSYREKDLELWGITQSYK